MTLPTTFPEVLDSTQITTYKSCPRKFFLEYCQNWKPRARSVHLVAGGAFARGLEVMRGAYFRDGRTPEDALALGMQALVTAYGDFECPEDSPKSCAAMCGALEYYAERFPLAQEDAPPHVIAGAGPAIEFSFAEPLPIVHPTTCNPLILAGRFDQIVDYAGGVWGEDDKTTGQLGATWGKQWDLRWQFSAYCWGAARAGIALDGFLVRGIAIRKTGFDAEQAITYRPQWMLDRWEAGMLRTVQEMVEEWNRSQGLQVSGVRGPSFPHAESDACTSYGGCMFRNPCLSQDPAPWLATSFTQRVWNPLTRSED